MAPSVSENDPRPSLKSERLMLGRDHDRTGFICGKGALDGERFRVGERISSCLAKSTVNAVISKRFAKRQQMQWTKRGAHLLRQIRTRTLDGTLRPLFEQRYPRLANDNAAGDAQAAA